MLPEAYAEFTERLKDSLVSDDRVLGLIAVGSMARVDYEPDQWSDHDFFVITRPGQQEFFRSNVSWLPPHKKVVFTFRETAHGVKVLYQDGHLLEFAVFDLEELYLARTNRVRVLFDKGDVREHVENIQKNSSSRREIESDDTFLVGQFLTNLLVGVARYRRGEKLSGRFFVKTSGLRNLLILLQKHIPSPQKSMLDDLDPHRRFEFAYPELGKELDGILELETPSAARDLLMLARRELHASVENFPVEAFQVVLNYVKG